MTAPKRQNLMKAKKAAVKREFRLKNFLSLRGMALFLLVLAVGGMGVIGFVSGAAAGRISDGVTIGTVPVGGMTQTEATERLGSVLADYSLQFRANGLTADIKPLSAGRNGRAIAAADSEKAVREAFAVGRKPGKAKSAMERAVAYLMGHRIEMDFRLDEGALKNELETAFAGIFYPAVNAQVKVSVEGNGSIRKETVPERPGTNLDTEHAVTAALSRLNRLSSEPIAMAIRYDQPKITLPEAERAVGDVDGAMARAPLTLTAKTAVWSVSRSQLAGWLDVVSREDGTTGLGFSDSAIRKYLESKAPEFAVPPTDAIFEMTDGRVIRIEPHKNGERLDIDGAVRALEAAVFGPEKPPERIELPIISVEPEITTEKSNPYGIREIIGVGESNFRGSPANRRSNIAVGAASLNGLVVPPNTEFSLVKALGSIDGEHGYKQELVIKDNRTVPEYGGGLCQIGTTAFRVALASGLPITERRNHSYRVSYYELDGDGKYVGPGKDATIYDPSPDLKFKNDTGHAIVIMTAIDGNRLTFTFWGVSDGRVAEQGKVSVWDITPPPEKKLVPSADLAPGVEKCTESPHAGAKASFDYTVTYPDGREEKQAFYSLYRPWGEVCLIGIDPNAPPLPENSGSGTAISADASGAAGE
ncbi:VanW family protein [Candidatus Uhrbacteria bacterium]|nr:VanW family protein [Candidatus Uhrbacteria bacterium]